MKQFTLFAIAACLVLPGCRKSVDLPSCIRAKIEEAAANPSMMIVKVDEYRFHGKTVYVFAESPDIADGGATVYDRNCNPLCFIGGIAGMVNCEGQRFEGNAVFKRTVWKK